MTRLFKLFSIFLFIQFFSISPVHSLEIKDRNEYLIDVRGDDGDIYLNRFSLNKKMDASGIQISAFGELQWNLKTNEWEKQLFGIEIGRLFWEKLYIGQSLQTISGQMLDYMTFDADSYSIDATTKLNLYLTFLKDYTFRVFEEYSINLEKGRDEYCETGAEVIYTFRETSSIAFGWRHTDRIHNLDTDYVSLSLTLSF